MNKKKISILTILSIELLSLSLFSCGTNNSYSVESIINEAEKLDRKDLFKRAMNELNGKTMYALGNSSRSTTAIEYFINYLKGKSFDNSTKTFVDDLTIQKEFSYYNPNFTGTIEYTQPVNNRIFSFISSDIRSSTHTLSMALVQDGNQIQSKMLNNGYLLNYIPKEWEGDKATNGEPLALQSLNKVFVYNNLGTKKFTNVWDFVANGFSTEFMPLNSEPVGKNFLYMLTREDYASIVKEAYNSYSGDKTTIDETIDNVTPLVKKFGLNKNAVYSLAWIKLFVKQFTIEDDDAPIANNLTSVDSKDEAGLLVYSKFRLIKETSDVSNKFVTIAAYQDNYEGFGGYMYKHYLQILKTSPYPWTSCALINFLVTTQYGYSPWGKEYGGYCSNPSSNQDHSNDGGSEYPIKNDRGYDWWTINTKGKGRLLSEDPVYCTTMSYTIGNWIDTL